MPVSAPKPCTKHPAILILHNKPCPQCEAVKKGKERERREKRGKRVYDTTQWKKTRKAKLSANPLCEHCGYIATEVDHKDGCNTNMNWDNLQSLCKSCHSRKTASENGGFGR